MRTLVLLLLVASTACSGGNTPTPPPPPPTSPGATADPADTNAPHALGGKTGVDDCAPHGACVAVSECSPDKGHLVYGHGCGAPHIACCSLGEGSCGGRETWSCCKDGQEARPVCKDGGLTCLVGWTTGEKGGCAKSPASP